MEFYAECRSSVPAEKPRTGCPDGEEWEYNAARRLYIREDGLEISYPSGGRYPDATDIVVLSEDFADPTAVKVDGEYYAYGTSTTRIKRTKSSGGSEEEFLGSGEFVWDNFEEVPIKAQVARSKDLKDWELLSTDALANLPEWLPMGRNVECFIWASHPVVLECGTMLLYYSILVKEYDDASKQVVCNIRSHISVAMSDRPDKPFQDISKAPIISGPGAECVDPFVYYDAGEWRLIIGSDGADITEHALTDDGQRLKYSPAGGKSLLSPSAGDVYRRVNEAAYKFDRLLLTSGADCFGSDKPYNQAFADEPESPYDWYRYGGYAIMQALFDEETGQYRPRADEAGHCDDVVFEGNEAIKNPGNNCVVEALGRLVLVGHFIDRDDQYHARTPAERARKENKRKMFAVEVFTRNDGSLYVPGGQYHRDHLGPEHSVKYFK